MPSWRCSTGILRRPSSVSVSGGGQTQSHFGTIAARSTRHFGTIIPTSVMVIALRSAAISLFETTSNQRSALSGQPNPKVKTLPLISGKLGPQPKRRDRPQVIHHGGPSARHEAPTAGDRKSNNKTKSITRIFTTEMRRQHGESLWKRKAKLKIKFKTINAERTENTEKIDSKTWRQN